MLSERMYRALLWAYPRQHRREYGEPMVQLFRDRMRRDGGGVRTLVVWVQMVFDLVGSAFKERKEEAVLERAMIKKAVARSAGLLLRSLFGALVIYLVITAVVLSAGLVSLLTGWYPFAIESGPLGFLGYTMVIDNKTNFHVSSEISWYGVLVLVVAWGILIRVWSAVRALRSSY